MDAQEIQFFTAILIACLVVGSIFLFYFYSLMRQQRKISEIQRQNATAEITALEKDRARIAADLHDDLAPMLAAVKLRINSFDLEDPDDREQLKKTNGTIDDIASRMRAISFDLMPSTLQVKGLTIALHEFLNYIERNETLKIRLTTPDHPLSLNEQKTINIYRMVQEIIHNTIKHAGASELVILLQTEKNRLTLSAQDNGIGFNYNTTMKDNTGLGLRSLLNRANMLHAEFTINSQPGLGTQYLFKIPI